MARIDQPSVRWHLVQMLGEVTLRPPQRERALTVLWDCVDHAGDRIVLNYSLEVLAGFVRQDPVLRERFVAALLRIGSIHVRASPSEPRPAGRAQRRVA